MSKRLLFAPFLVLADGTQNPAVTQAVDVSRATEVTIFVEYNAQVTGGPLILQSAPEQNFAGAWATEGSSTGVASASDRITAKDGVLLWVRVDPTGLTGAGAKAKIWLNAWVEL